MNFDNFTYYRMMEENLKNIKNLNKKPTLLLHSCCAPCNAFPLVLLVEYFDLTLMYNNSNIYPSIEYYRRLNELKKYVEYINQKYHVNIKIIETPYNNEEYNKFLEPYKNQKEGLDRCKLCYKIRMNEAYKYANDHNYDYFTTVMTISRQKNSIVLNNIGLELQKKYPNTKYFVSDFKKNKGIDKGLEIAKEHNMYRQDYCGCIYSYNKKRSDMCEK